MLHGHGLRQDRSSGSRPFRAVSTYGVSEMCRAASSLRDGARTRLGLDHGTGWAAPPVDLVLVVRYCVLWHQRPFRELSPLCLRVEPSDRKHEHRSLPSGGLTAATGPVRLTATTGHSGKPPFGLLRVRSPADFSLPASGWSVAHARGLTCREVPSMMPGMNLGLSLLLHVVGVVLWMALLWPCHARWSLLAKRPAQSPPVLAELPAG